MKVNMILILKIASFISSLFPLSVYLFIKYFGNEKAFNNNGLLTPNNTALVLVLFEVASVFFVIYYYKVYLKSNNNNFIKIKLSNIQQEKANTTSYLLSNVLPIISLDFSDVAGVTFAILLVLFMGIMYLKNNLYYINPLYDLIGVKTYNATIISIDDDDNKIKELHKTLISTINLYEFDNSKFKSLENSDTLIVFKEL
jgi:hypothetical protein